MEMNKILIKGKIKRKISYKRTVFQYLLLLIAALLLLFCIYTYYDYHMECRENAYREAEITVNRIVSQNDARLRQLQQYYVTMAEEAPVKWLLENNIQYSDYSSYKNAYDNMASRGIFGDYISGFTFANFKTGWILSNKGLYHLYEAYNADTIMGIYEEKTKNAEKNYWKYDNAGVVPSSQLDRNYRIIIETEGLNFIMHLPGASYNTYAVFIANISIEAWKKWVIEWMQPCEDVVVLDNTGGLIYATDEGLAKDCMAFWRDQAGGGYVKKGTKRYQAASAVSEFMGWHYYVLYDVDEGQTAMRVPMVLFFILALMAGACLFLVSKLIYYPIGALVRDVSGMEEKSPVVKNELEYISGSIYSLKEDKQALQGLLTQQQGKLLEMFELRLMRNEVDSDEWEEYLSGLKLRSWNYFATVVVILNLELEEIGDNMINEDVICLKMLQEMPDDLRAMAWMPPVYNAGTIFAIFAEEDENTLFETIKKFSSGMRECACVTGGFHVMTGVSATHTQYRHIRMAYRESISALAFRLDLGEDSEEECYFYLAGTTSQGKKYNRSYEEDIRAAVKAVDKQKCYQATDDFYMYLREMKGRENEMGVYLLRFVNTIMLTAAETGIDIGKVYPDGIRRTYMELLEVMEPERERRYIKWKFIDPLIRERTEFLENHAETMVGEIESLIVERKGNISLPECAEALGVHPTYIWKLLKMERHKSFSEYVEEYKLAEAKRLLLETQFTVAEIAEQLNYTNAQNFIRFFNKAVGVTPGKFRKLY